jgi:replicative DNA helicase
MNALLLTQWQRLIFPPDGRRTYAVNPVYPGPDGDSDLCRWAVLDIDEGADSLPKARALLALCEVAALSARAAWSGGKGCHVWLFFEPAPVSLATAVLKRLQAAVPFTGELIPGDAPRAKVPPALHQEKRFWAFFFETLPDTAPALESLPTGFLEAQAGILAGVVPTAVPVLVAYANAGGDRREPEPEQDMVPDLGKLGGDLAPCMAALVERGAQSALGGWDKNALTLARYVKAAGIEPDAALTLLKTVSDNTGPDFPTGKDWDAKARHWASIKEPGAFGCGFILAARQALGFRCKGCPARPIGVKAGKADQADKAGATSNAPGNGTPINLDNLIAALPDNAKTRALSLRDALAAITKDASLGKHGAATTIGFGLCNEYDGGELGAALALDWDTNTGGNAAAVYGKADPNYAGKGRPVTADSIFKLARQCGWRPAQAQGAVPEPDAAALLLEPALADSLLQLALQTGLPEARIDPAIFPPEKLRAKDPITGEPIEAALHALAWAGIGAGATTPAALLNWVDRQPSKEPPGPPVKAALAALVARLLGLSPVPEPEAAALITRAADLTARLQLLSALGTGTAATNDRKPLMDVIGGLHETTARLQQAAGTTWGAPLTAYAAELLDGLIQVDRPTVATPFPTLNDLLGGGLHGGKLYVMAAPPGGGKTTLATQIADHAAAAGIPTCYVALEMGRPQLFDYALSRHIGMNSAKVEARNYRHSETERERLAAAALDYLDTVAPWLSVIEGDWGTTAAALNAWVVQARARYGITASAPVLICVDYLQLLNTGDEKLDSGQANETAKVSQVAVQLKQLARDTGAAILALSDIIKSEQGAAIKGSEFTLNMLRGSNRIAHAADTVLALYSEAGKGDGGKADNDPWAMLASKYQDSPNGRDFARGLDDLRHAHPTGGPGASVRARLELLKNRGGRGRGSQVLLYERAYHRFQGLSVPGQDAAEGRGDPDSPAPSSNYSSYSAAQGGGSTKPGATGRHAPRSKPASNDPDRAWKAEKKRYQDSGEAQQHIDPVTGAIDPNFTPDWLHMKNEAARQKEARRNGGGDY